MAKSLIGLGIVLIVIGVLWQVGLFKMIPLGRLPGDIRIEGKNSSIYIPITTCVLISLLASGLLHLFRRFF